MNATKNIINSFSHLFFPHTCAGCGTDLITEEQLLCIQCYSQLPFTGFELYADNVVEKNFWGRLPIDSAMSLLYFTKDSIIQNLIHQFKYKGKKEIGLYLGNMMGQKILSSDRFTNIDRLIPLPLFATKEKRRGYNQSFILCEGIAEILKIPVLKNSVIRTSATETQTHKTRIERWQNTNGQFEVKESRLLQDKHILLVDDIVTTGATLEACALEMMQSCNLRISIATLAYTLI
ncbi:MAG TPA: phosphoribosyltransferase family protein [Puia sp.]|nr:phosphoribosyltransferase family protein [Puia sp.]